MRLARVTLIWALLAAAVFVPIAAAAASPLLEWRGPVYILAGFAGIIALGLMLVQPLLIAGYLPGLSAYRGRRAHHWIGGALVVMVVIHVGGLWITSPPDMIDALLFTSPTPFSPSLGGATARSPGGTYMTTVVLNRRNLLAAGGSVLATGVSGLLLPARAQGLAPTPSMSGGSNNYRKGAPIVDRIGKGGFWMSGTVRRAGDGAPLAGQRIQIWAHTTEGQEHEPQSHGATLTDKNGVFRLEMPQIIPIFGQPHGHLAYDSGEFKTVFLRPVMRSAKETSLEAHFVLQPA